jgi:ATP-dependent Clp protease ATP-binding subunit ClpB
MCFKLAHTITHLIQHAPHDTPNQPQVARVALRLADKKMRLELSDGALSRLAADGYDPVYGARPVKRAVQRELETPLAKALLRGEFEEEDTVLADAAQDGKGLTFRRGPKVDAAAFASPGGYALAGSR